MPDAGSSREPDGGHREGKRDVILRRGPRRQGFARPKGFSELTAFRVRAGQCRLVVVGVSAAFDLVEGEQRLTKGLVVERAGELGRDEVPGAAGDDLGG